MGVALFSLRAAERGGEAQMWDRAPGPLPAESEMEEGSGRQGVAAAMTSQVRLGFRTGTTEFAMCVSFPQPGNQGLPTALIFTPTLPIP